MGQSQAVETASDDAISDELKPGHTLMQGQYTIDAFLNAGGFGITYLARNSLDRKVVIKECFPGSFCRRTPTSTSVQARSRSHTKEFSSIVSRFVDEAHSLAKVKHPNIVGVHQVFEENNTAYMALDFVEGCDLLDVISAPETLPEPKEIEAILAKVLDAVSCIHDQDMLHRDISPDNILLKPNMEPVLIDFGAVRHDAGQENRILSELRVIKDGYSPQEFYVAGAEQGPYSDLYALAASFYHVITGELPVNAQKRLASIAAGDNDPYVPVAGRIPGYSEPFLSGIDKALAILPKNRIGSARLWLDLLNGTDTAGAAPSSTKSPEVVPVADAPASPSAKKTKARVLAVIGLAVPIIGAIYVMQQGDNGPSAEAEQTLLADAEPAISADAADPTLAAEPAAVPVPSEEATAPEPDLSAILNIAAVAPQTEDASTEVAGLPAELAPSDTSPVQDQEAVVTSPATVDDEGVSAAPNPPEETAALDIAEPAPAPEAVTEAPSATPSVAVESFDLPQVISAWSVDLTGALPAETDAIYAINGLPLDGDASLDTALHKMMEAPESATLELSVLAGDSEETAVLETVVVPVIHKTTFEDGTVFESSMIDGVWTTVVTDVPAGSEFEVDDVLVGDMGTNERFDKRTSLPDVLVEANAQNLERLTLAVRRDGVMSPISMLIPG